MSCTSSITDFFLLSSFFFLHLLSLLSQLTETDGAGASLAEWDGTGRDDAGMRDGTGDRRAGGGGRRREASWNLEGWTATEDEAGWRASKSERRLGNIVVILPPPWLFGQGMDNVFSK